jgi:toxin FitB
VSYLLDTCVISELLKAKPEPRVTEWASRQREESLFLSCLAIGEVQSGIQRLPPGGRRDRLDRRLREEVRARFGGRVLAVDQDVALAWGSVQAVLESRGTPMAAVDGLLSSTCRVFGLTLVTRNTDHYKDPEVPLHNPWS